jgi:hypothetical protein
MSFGLGLYGSDYSGTVTGAGYVGVVVGLGVGVSVGVTVDEG